MIDCRDFPPSILPDLIDALRQGNEAKAAELIAFSHEAWRQWGEEQNRIAEGIGVYVMPGAGPVRTEEAIRAATPKSWRN
jgi:hypothetical protein